MGGRYSFSFSFILPVPPIFMILTSLTSPVWSTCIGIRHHCYHLPNILAVVKKHVLGPWEQS